MICIYIIYLLWYCGCSSSIGVDGVVEPPSVVDATTTTTARCCRWYIYVKIMKVLCIHHLLCANRMVWVSGMRCYIVAFVIMLIYYDANTQSSRRLHRHLMRYCCNENGFYANKDNVTLLYCSLSVHLVEEWSKSEVGSESYDLHNNRKHFLDFAADQNAIGGILRVFRRNKEHIMHYY
jgi:hypothetical protein